MTGGTCIMDDELLHLLACPKCKGPLIRRNEPLRLECLSDRLSFKVIDGVPILLLREAHSLDAGSSVATPRQRFPAVTDPSP
jgi:uncharacterized protein YbaR (Trm112 family)